MFRDNWGLWKISLFFVLARSCNTRTVAHALIVLQVLVDFVLQIVNFFL